MKFQYTGEAGMLDGVGNVSGPSVVDADETNPRIKRLVKIGTLTPLSDGDDVAIDDEEPVTNYRRMNKAELIDYAAAEGVFDGDENPNDLTKEEIYERLEDIDHA